MPSITLATPVAPWKTAPKTVDELYAIVNALCTKLVKCTERQPEGVGTLQVGVLIAAATALREMTGCDGPETDEEWAAYDALTPADQEERHERA